MPVMSTINSPKISVSTPSKEIQSALEVAAARPREGSWQSPRFKSAKLLFDEIDEFELNIENYHPGSPRIDEDTFDLNSLPRPMEQYERERVLRSIPPTAIFEMLSKIPREVLMMRGEEAQLLRCQLLRGSTIVFFCAGYPGKKFIYEKAAELGVKSVIIDNEDSWSRSLVDEGVIAKFIPVDMTMNTDAVFQAALSSIKSLESDTTTGPAVGISTFVELAISVVSRLAEALGLPGSSPYSIDSARDKHKTKEAIRKAGLPSTRNFLISNESQLSQAAEFVGFPSVIKPIAGAASLGVQKVSNEKELVNVYQSVLKIMKGLVVSSGALEAMPQMVGDAPPPPSSPTSHINASSVIDTSIMLEEYLDGDEVDIDIILSCDECVYLVVSDNGPTKEPYFGETWGVIPSALPDDKVEALGKMALDSLKALSFKEGVFHVEGKWTSKGPRLIEINARMGGGPVRFAHCTSTGVDLVVESLLISVGIPSRPVKHNYCHVGYADVNAEKSGHVASLSFLDNLPLDSVGCNLVYIKPSVVPNERIVGNGDGMPTWLAEIMVKGANGVETKARLIALYDLILKEFEINYV